MVGAVRFELTTSCTRNKRASQATLRPEPKNKQTLEDWCQSANIKSAISLNLFCLNQAEAQAHSEQRAKSRAIQQKL
jgi:hypothetical protein